MLRPPQRSGISSFRSHLCASNSEADLFKTVPTLQALQNASAPCRKHKVELQILLSEQLLLLTTLNVSSFLSTLQLRNHLLASMQLKGIQLQLQLQLQPLIASICASRK